MKNGERLEHLRHSLAHLLAAAVTELWPDVKHTIGPAIENGFYYDFEFNTPISSDDLPAIESKMREILPSWDKFECREVSVEEAKKYFIDNPYKLELIGELAEKGEKITLYTSGDFTDLCAGGHIESARNIDPKGFTLTHIAGAYWRGNENNKMLTRIYGVAFATKNELDEHLRLLEEAEKRDHRKLGKELDLFVFSDVVGKGLPMFTEKGTTLRRELERFIVDEEIKRGYSHVYTPDIAKLDLYRKSGHYPYYKDSMYAPIKIDDEEFMLRPMTCPHHFELYLSKPRSYRDLPMRMAELAKLYRYEQSGELTGLMRVRTFCLADAHIICKDKRQTIEEIGRVLDLIEYVASVLGLEMKKDYWYRLSLGDREDDKKYFKNDEAWEESENSLRKLLKDRNCHFFEAEKEAAFYGPKIDVQMRNVRGKEDTAFTVQYDFCMPERFNLTYTDIDGREKRVGAVVHRSSIGAIERSLAFLIEHYAGAFPLWLSPIQASVLPIGENHKEYARRVFQRLKESNIRAKLDESNETLNKRIRSAKLEKIPYFLVIGDKEIATKTVTLESRDKGNQGRNSIEDVCERLKEEVLTKKASG
jgi:threonyl-tRNA synthetase